MTINPYHEYIMKVGFKTGDRIKFTKEAMQKYPLLKRTYANKIFIISAIMRDGSLLVAIGGSEFEYSPLLFEKA